LTFEINELAEASLENRNPSGTRCQAMAISCNIILQKQANVTQLSARNVKTRTTSYMQNTISPILNKFERFSPNM
jgi:hypothetical protein